MPKPPKPKPPQRKQAADAVEVGVREQPRLEQAGAPSRAIIADIELEAGRP